MVRDVRLRRFLGILLRLHWDALVFVGNEADRPQLPSGQTLRLCSQHGNLNSSHKKHLLFQCRIKWIFHPNMKIQWLSAHLHQLPLPSLFRDRYYSLKIFSFFAALKFIQCLFSPWCFNDIFLSHTTVFFHNFYLISYTF